MGLTNMNRNRPIIITGKTGTGKSTMWRFVGPIAKSLYKNINDAGVSLYFE